MKSAKTNLLVIASMVLSLGGAYGMKVPNKAASQCSGKMCEQKKVSARYGRILAIANNRLCSPAAPSQAAQGVQEEGLADHQQLANRPHALPSHVVDQAGQDVNAQQVPVEPILAQEAIVLGPQEGAPVQLGAPMNPPVAEEPSVDAEFVMLPAGNENNEIVPVVQSFGQRFMAGLCQIYSSAKSSVEDLVKKARE